MANGCLLYYITDRTQFRGDEALCRRALLSKIADAARAGVDYIQLREKDLSGRQLETLTREAVALVREVREVSGCTRLLVNSRVDVALAAGADGVHLREEDVAPDNVRCVSGAAANSGRPGQSPDHFLIGVSCHKVTDVKRAESEGVDFAVLAPVFGKSGAPGKNPTGLAALEEACRAKIPVIALGGITLKNAAACLSAGATGVAGIRLFQENNIDDVVRALRASVVK
ncbi:MAG TPA: thiamine phosphate synthase [Terriglobales bacterium]|nr:thiamine phosphate synthase [Terriglobales bacterium]